MPSFDVFRWPGGRARYAVQSVPYRETVMSRETRVGSKAPIAGPPVRVLYLIDSLGRGGAEHLLAAYLPILAELGVVPEVCALQERDGNPLEKTLRDGGIGMRTLDIARLRQPDAYRQVASVIEETNPDLIHTQLEFATILGGLAARRRGIPCICTLHTMGRPAPRTSDALRFRLESRALRRWTDRVVAVSETARDEYLETLRLNPGQIVTIHNGIDTERFALPARTRRTVRADLGIPGSAVLAVTVAVLRPPKGIDDMLDAMPYLLKAVPNAHYLLVGDGSARRQLEGKVQDLGLTEHVTFAGERDDVARILNAADIFVLPTHTEALPTVIAEAMAAGLPVVATRVGGIPEMIDADTGILVEPRNPARLADAVVSIAADPSKARRMGAVGHQVAADRFDIRKQASKLVAEYHSLVNPRTLS